MHRKLLIGRIQIRIVATSSDDGRLGVIGHRQRRCSAVKFRRVDVRLNPGFQLLIASRFRVGLRTGSQHRNKQRRWPGLPRRGVIHGDRRPGPVDELFLPGLVFLTQHHIQVLPPVLIALAKPAVAIALGIPLPVFFPHQLQRQMAMLLELLMNGFSVRLWPLPHRPDRHGMVPKQLGFQFFFAPAFGPWPDDSSRHRPLQILMDRAQPHSATACNLPLPEPNSNRNHRTSLTLRMDDLLAGTLFSLPMEFQCRDIVQRRLPLLRCACGKHSAPSRTRFR